MTIIMQYHDNMTESFSFNSADQMSAVKLV